MFVKVFVTYAHAINCNFKFLLLLKYFTTVLKASFLIYFLKWPILNLVLNCYIIHFLVNYENYFFWGQLLTVLWAVDSIFAYQHLQGNYLGHMHINFPCVDVTRFIAISSSEWTKLHIQMQSTGVFLTYMFYLWMITDSYSIVTKFA